MAREERDAVIEECAKIADEAQVQAMRPHTSMYPWIIASRIRDLKSAKAEANS